MPKRIIAVIALVLISALALTACTGTKVNKTEAPTFTVPIETPVESILPSVLPDVSPNVSDDGHYDAQPSDSGTDTTANPLVTVEPNGAADTNGGATESKAPAGEDKTSTNGQ